MYKLALVIDEVLGPRLLELAQACYVWVVESEVNLPWIRQAWGTDSLDDGDPLFRGVTSFVRYPGEEDEGVLVRVLDMIDEHHGEGAHEPPWSQIDVYGAALSPGVSTIMQEYGVNRFDEMTDGFRIYRDEYV